MENKFLYANAQVFMQCILILTTEFEMAWMHFKTRGVKADALPLRLSRKKAVRVA